ncbi:MAG: hypothetical protein ABI345_13110 [Jatrophihabitans sp.]
MPIKLENCEKLLHCERGAAEVDADEDGEEDAEDEAEDDADDDRDVDTLGVVEGPSAWVLPPLTETTTATTAARATITAIAIMIASARLLASFPGCLGGPERGGIEFGGPERGGKDCGGPAGRAGPD